MSKESFEPYQPLEEEMENAEEMMTEEQKEMSEERIETWIFPDLRGYIKANKIVELPNTEILNEELKEEIKKNKRLHEYYDSILTFIDNEGNVAKVKIDPEKIAYLKGKILNGPYNQNWELVEKYLVDLGFIPSQERVPNKDDAGNIKSYTIKYINDDTGNLFSKAYHEGVRYERRQYEQLQKEIEQKKKEEFDF